MPRRSTKAEQAEATRAVLLDAAEALFREHTFAGTSTEAILERTKVTRGALYYHFEDKADLMRAVCERVYETLAQRIDAAATKEATAWSALLAGTRAFMRLTADASTVRLLFLDGPAVLGRKAWDEIEQQHGLRSLAEGLQAAIDEGSLPAQPVAPLAAVLNGAMNEAVLYGTSGRPRAASEATATIERLLLALHSPQRRNTP